MLEKLKAQVLLAYQELNRYGLDKFDRGTVSAIDRESGMIVMKSARSALVVDMQGNILEGAGAAYSDVQSHIAIYRAFPQGDEAFREQDSGSLRMPAALVVSHGACAWGETALDAVANACHTMGL